MTPRLDVEMVRRGLARSRSEARALVRDGWVTVAGSSATRPARTVDGDSAIEVSIDAPRWVSRGGQKLDAALEAFALDVEGRRAADVGASAGGFTQVLLERGAASVLALDVGHGQLAPGLAGDSRVSSWEGRNVREVTTAELGGCFDLVVVDLSFISLRKVAASLANLACDGADLVVLVKPQFEVGRGALAKDGVVRDAGAREDAVRGAMDALEAAGIAAQGIVESPVKGGDGNVEYLLWAVRGRPAKPVEIPR